jgi:hypothetical protein|tara:strand:+ start:342 stop:800 length:459 start_codon:yes stop_codon:yes gene_type:complete
MSKFKKRLKRAAKVAIAGAALYGMSKMGADKKLISGKDSEVGAIASKAKPKANYITKKIAKDKAPVITDITGKSKIRSSRGAFDQVGGIEGKKFSGFKTKADVKARNEAFNKKLKSAKGERYSLLKSMGFAQGKMIQAKGGKEIVGKKTKLF